MNQKVDTLVRIYKMDVSEYRSYAGLGGPVCHYGRTPEGKVTAHVVKLEEQWAEVKVKPRGISSHGCLVHMKEFWPEAFQPAVGKEMNLSQANPKSECPACSTLLSEDVQVEQGYKCEACLEIVLADDHGGEKLWECSNGDCGQIFTAEGRDNCPQCGRAFTRKLADVGCGECEEGEMVGVMVKQCQSCDVVFEAAA